MNEPENKKESFSRRLERKLQIIPVVGADLSIIPSLVTLTKQYFKKEYPEFPLGSLIAIIIIFAYLLYPLDIIPDAILGLGQLDDLGVFLACWKLIKSDVSDYRKWRDT